MGARGGEWSITRICDELGMERRTVAKRITGLPYRVDEKHGGKMYPVRAVMSAIFAGETGNIEDAKTRKAFADAVRAEIAVLKERGEVAMVADLEREMTDMLTAFRAKLLGMPDRLAALLDATRGIDAKRKIIRKACDEALNELHTGFSIDAGPSAGDDSAAESDSSADQDQGGEDGVETAAEEDAQPVVRRGTKAKSRSKR